MRESHPRAGIALLVAGEDCAECGGFGGDENHQGAAGETGEAGPVEHPYDTRR